MSNPYKRLLGLIAPPPTTVGQVVAVHSDGVTAELPTGHQIHARGQATLGDHVYIRAGVIEGPAPALPGIDIEI